MEHTETECLLRGTVWVCK